MKSRILASALIAPLTCLAYSTVFAADPLVGDAAAGAAKAAVCGACHGATGNSINPLWPSLAGQHQGYIAEQLALFKAGTRIAPVMQPMALTLSPQDMADLGAYFEKQALVGLEADPSLWQAGQRLYRGGDPKRSIPACIGCHGPNGRGNAPAHWPQIRAQQALYVAGQLKNYATRARYATVAGQPAPPVNADIMSDVAGRLAEKDISALAAYLQGLR
jgi:cytochrome c553